MDCFFAMPMYFSLFREKHVRVVDCESRKRDQTQRQTSVNEAIILGIAGMTSNTSFEAVDVP
jgi:hypothetical protein